MDESLARHVLLCEGSYSLVWVLSNRDFGVRGCSSLRRLDAVGDSTLAGYADRILVSPGRCSALVATCGVVFGVEAV